MAKRRPRVLILGRTGMLGHEAARVLAEEFEIEVRATTRRGAADGDLRFDAERPQDLPGLLKEAAPDAVLNCIGIVKQLAAAARPLPSIAINSLFPHQLAEACTAFGARLIHVSTDCVFSGELDPPARYGEDDPEDPRDLYGRSKLLGEVTDPPSLTLRTSIIGRELGRQTGLLEWLMSQEGQAIKGFSNAWFSGLTTTALARVVGHVVLEHPELSGLFQVAAEPISKLDLVTRLDSTLGLGCSIEPVSEPRINRALDPSRFLAATGYEAPSWDAMIGELAKEGTHV